MSTACQLRENVVSICDPLGMVLRAIEQADEVLEGVPCKIDDYHPLPESDEDLRRAAALMKQAIDLLRTVRAAELPRYLAWDAAQCATVPRSPEAPR